MDAKRSVSVGLQLQMTMLMRVGARYSRVEDEHEVETQEVESAWLPPCVVLVINDNLYGLMF